MPSLQTLRNRLANITRELGRRKYNQDVRAKNARNRGYQPWSVNWSDGNGWVEMYMQKQRETLEAINSLLDRQEKEKAREEARQQARAAQLSLFGGEG